MADAYSLPLGGFGFPTTTSGSFTNHSIDANNDALAIVFNARYAMTIERLGIRHGSTTGTSPNYKISLQDVDGSGNPSGTPLGGGSPASKVFSPSSLSFGSNTWQWLTLDNSYACARGQKLAIVVEYDSGTISGSAFSSFAQSFGYTSIGRNVYCITTNAGTPTRPVAGVPVFGYGPASATYGLPLATPGALVFHLTSSGFDEYGHVFTLPAAWGSTFKVAGIRLTGVLLAGGLTNLQLYEGGGASDMTLLQTASIDHDHLNTTGTIGDYELLFTDSTLATLSFGSTYRVTLQPQVSGSGTAVTAYYLAVSSASDWGAYPGGQIFGQTARLDAGNWTDTPTNRMYMRLILDDITAPSGGGTIITPPPIIMPNTYRNVG